MKGPDALMHLHAVAVMADMDVSGIECRHASIRSLLDQRHRSWSPLLATVSGDFLCRQVSAEILAALGGGPQARTVSAAARRTHGRRKRPPKKRRGGGGARRAFFSHKLRGQALWKMAANRRSAFFRTAHAQFRALDDSEKQRFHELGEAATISHRFQAGQGGLAS